MRIDWNYIHNDVLPTFEEGDQTTGQLIDFVAITVENMEAEAAAEQALDAQNEDSDTEEEEEEQAPPEPAEEEVRPELPPGLMPAARPSSRQLPPGLTPAEPPSSRQLPPGLAPAARPSSRQLPPGITPAEPPSAQQLPPGLAPAARPSSRQLPPGITPAAPPSARKHTAAAEEGAPGSASTPAAPPLPSRATQGAEPAPQPSKLDQGYIEQVKSLEAKRARFVQSLEPAFAKYKEAMERAHRELAAAMQAAAVGNGFDRETCENVMRAENGVFMSVLNTQLLRDNAPGVKCLEEQIEASNKGYRVRQSAITIQRAYRWYQYRKTCRDMSKANFRREKAVREIMESEDAYVQNLQLLMAEYAGPLKRMLAEHQMITAQQYKDLFLNLDEILAFNTRLLGAFQERMRNFDNRRTCIGDIFLQFPQMSTLYQYFVSNFDKSAAALNVLLENPAFVQWQERVAEQPQLHKLRINTLLIMPVQRVPRYSLLLRELISKTPETHPDYASLQKAFDFIGTVASGINEAKRRAEAHEKVADLQQQFRAQLPGLLRPFRSLVYEGPGARDSGMGLKPCYLFLLTDQMIFVKKKQSDKILCRVILLGAEVSELPENRDPDCKWNCGFQVRTPRTTVNFYLDYDEECAKLLKLVESTIKELPAVLERYPRDKEQLLALTAKARRPGDPAASGIASEIPMNAHVKDIMGVFNDIVKVQAELMQMPIDLRTMFPQFYAQLHPDHIQRLRTRIEALGSKLTTLDELNKRATQLLKSEQAFFTLDKIVCEGTTPIEAMERFITAAFPKVPGTAPLPRSRDPQFLMRYVLFWYVKLSEAWEVVTDLSL